MDIAIDRRVGAVLQGAGDICDVVTRNENGLYKEWEERAVVYRATGLAVERPVVADGMAQFTRP